LRRRPKGSCHKGGSLDYPKTSKVFAKFSQNEGEFSEKEALGKDKRSLPQKVKLPQRLSVAKATQSEIIKTEPWSNSEPWQ